MKFLYTLSDNDAGSIRSTVSIVFDIEDHVSDQKALVRVVQHLTLKDLSSYLETPNELTGYAKEIALMREREHS